jgi:hypothetical protein
MKVTESMLSQRVQLWNQLLLAILWRIKVELEPDQSPVFLNQKFI